MTIVVTDNGAGFRQEEIEKLGIKVLPLRFFIDNIEYKETDLSTDTFFDKLKNAKDIQTSQPTLAEVEDTFDNLFQKYEHIIYVPMSSGLSGTYSTGVAISENEKYKNKITVIDAKAISVTQRFVVFDILDMLNKNLSPIDIKNKIESNNKNASIYIMVDTLEYLKKGGRVSPLVATVGSLLHIKPIMYTGGGPFDVSKKERTIQNAKNTMLDLISQNMKEKFGSLDSSDYSIGIAYTKNLDEAMDFKQKVIERFGEFGREIPVDPLSSFIACHIGPNSLGVGIYKNIDEY